MVLKFSPLLLWALLGSASVVLSADVLAQTARPEPARPSEAPASSASGNAEKGRPLNQAQGPADSAQLFARLDRNRDGYLSAAELEDRQGDWIALDRDGDGRISRSEFQALR
jgi:hypothetical protein